MRVDRLCIREIIVRGQLSNGQRAIPRLELEGWVELESGKLKAVDSYLIGHVEFRGEGFFRLGRVLKHTGIQEPEVIIDHGYVEIDSVQDTTIQLVHGTLDIALSRRPSENVILRGQGTVNIRGKLLKATFEEPPEDAEPIELTIESSGEVSAARGVVTLTAKVDSFCSGDPICGGLGLATIRSADGAELQDVNIYGLSLRDLPALEKVHRFSPWIPPPAQAREFEDAMKLGTDDEALRRNRSVHFWSAMVAIMENTHAVEHVRSEVRFAAARARQRALASGSRKRRLATTRAWLRGARSSLRQRIQWNREVVLLHMYSIVGYGERVWRPIFVILAGTMLGTVILVTIPNLPSVCCGTFRDWWGTFFHLLLLPLTFLRLRSDPEVSPRQDEGILEPTVEVIVGILNALMLFFTITAIRRVTKAE